ncbi:lysophospholipid acyltransferase family protein [Geoalkalibacter halelectricus]|uniref:lysophospholipid acyltransferase family protein n=1 Tax=Geoalkalibacter halelectricus TaxID=2847045 RepID=UPI003D1A8F86
MSTRPAMRFSDRLLVAVLPWIASFVIRVLYRMMRIEFLGEERVRALWKDGGRVIVAFWHEHLLLMVKSYRGPGGKILISASKDGEIIARTMELFGLGTVRGSSSRGGAAALRSLVQLSKEPCDLAITPDGPRGPRRHIKDGLVHLARLSGRPVIPVAFVCSRGRRFASWDRFLLPYPFSRGVFSFGAPMLYERGEDPETFRARLQQAMDDNERRAAARLEEQGVSAV